MGSQCGCGQSLVYLKTAYPNVEPVLGRNRTFVAWSAESATDSSGARETPSCVAPRRVAVGDRSARRRRPADATLAALDTNNPHSTAINYSMALPSQTHLSTSELLYYTMSRDNMKLLIQEYAEYRNEVKLALIRYQCWNHVDLDDIFFWTRRSRKHFIGYLVKTFRYT